MITSKDERFGGAVRGYRKDPVYRVMIRNHKAEADECLSQHLSRTRAMSEAQAVSTLGNTAWVTER